MNTVNPENFNETMYGYVVRAIRLQQEASEHVNLLGVNDQVFSIFQGLKWATAEMTMEDARREYEEYRKNKIELKKGF